MIAQREKVEAEAPAPRGDGVEHADVRARGPELLEHRGIGADATDGVVDDCHLHAACRRGAQGVGEASPRVVGIEPVHLEQNLLARRFDGRKHARVRLHTVAQELHAIVAYERLRRLPVATRDLVRCHAGYPASS